MNDSLVKDGSPLDVAWAKIQYIQTHYRWVSSFSSELFFGEVQCTTEEYLAATEEYHAAMRRHRVWQAQQRRPSARLRRVVEKCRKAWEKWITHQEAS